MPHQPPRSWKAAQSVDNQATGKPWIRISLRGERPVGTTTSLRFAYHLTGARSFEIVLTNSRTKGRVTRHLDGLIVDTWSDRHIDLDTPMLQAADELQILLPAGATLQVDDVLLYEPRE